MIGQSNSFSYFNAAETRYMVNNTTRMLQTTATILGLIESMHIVAEVKANLIE